MALLVFGVGVVGYAALQLKSVKQVEETYSRSQAMSVAQDFIERAKANNVEDAMDIYLSAANWTGQLNDPGSCAVTDTVPSADDACSGTAMAQYDIYQVRSGLTSLLTNGKINFATCGGIYCVTVAWAETQLADCDQTAFANGERQDNAHCVQVEFIP